MEKKKMKKMSAFFTILIHLLKANTIKNTINKKTKLIALSA